MLLPGLSFFLVGVRGLLTVVASLVVEHVDPGLRLRVVAGRLSCPVACGILVPRPGIEAVSLALTSRLLTICMWFCHWYMLF